MRKVETSSGEGIFLEWGVGQSFNKKKGEYVTATMAIVEFKDGHVELVEVRDVKFLD